MIQYMPLGSNICKTCSFTKMNFFIHLWPNSKIWDANTVNTSICIDKGCYAMILGHCHHCSLNGDHIVLNLIQFPA